MKSFNSAVRVQLCRSPLRLDGDKQEGSTMDGAAIDNSPNRYADASHAEESDCWRCKCRRGTADVVVMSASPHVGNAGLLHRDR